VSRAAFSCPHCGRPLRDTVDEWTASRRKALITTYLGLVVAGLLLVASGAAFGIRGLMAAGATIAAFGALNNFVVTVVMFVTRQ